MGAWSHEPFGNDAAGDWAHRLFESDDLSYIETTLDKVSEQSSYLEAPDAEEAIAAVEVLAKALGKGTQSGGYTEEVDAWVAALKEKPSIDLLQKADRVLRRIVSKDSELLELWSESAEEHFWRSSIAALHSSINV
jgi:hypothetical protein